MSLKIIFGSTLSLVGIFTSLLGLMFVMATGEKQSRIIVGIILLVLGIIILIFGLALFRKGIRFSPEGIKKRILKLAKMNNGELPEDVITADLGNSDDVKFQVQVIVSSGIASEQLINNRTVYVFKDFQMKLVMKECPYCGNDYPVKGDIEKCPSCGGDLKMNKKNMTEKDEKFSLDEDDDSGLM